MSFMDRHIIESKLSRGEWLDHLGQPVAARLLAWEQAQSDALLADVFGYHAVQLGWSELAALRTNRMPHRWLAQAEFEQDFSSGSEASTGASQLCIDSRAWPWASDSLDLVVLPHALERSADPHACLREVERVLIPEGQVLITGINPWSWWGVQQSLGHRRGAEKNHDPASLIGYRRLRDWLRLLGFEVQVSRFWGWTPALGSEVWMQRLGFMDRLGARWWPIFGGTYLLMATKRVPGGRLIDGRRWRTVRSPTSATAPITRCDPSAGPVPASKDFVEPR